MLGSVSSRWYKTGTSKELCKSESKTLQFSHLDPYRDANGVLRVGGRFGRTSLDDSTKHPVILPGDSIVITRLVLIQSTLDTSIIVRRYLQPLFDREYDDMSTRPAV